jgi:threonine aldolase
MQPGYAQLISQPRGLRSLGCGRRLASDSDHLGRGFSPASHAGKVGPMIDLRSDTVTRPTAAMREAMAQAEVGDDVFGDDPTVNALEEEVARITGKQAALFVSTGTMGNQLAIATQTRPGDDVIVGEGAHPVINEAAAGAALSGVQFTMAGRGGFFTADELEAAMYPRLYWAPRTSLASIENTHNRAGGRVWPLEQARAVAERARALGLATHLDGARIWNASVATGVDVATWCAPFDTVSVCFSKGLGAPVGSAFCGPKALVVEARRFRKRWGGGMRQSGILAAAALHALAHHRARLAEDHVNARALAEALSRAPGFRVEPATVETNLVNLDLDVPADAVSRKAKELGLLINTSGPRRLRAVTHLDVSRTDMDAAAEILGRALANLP